MSRTAWMGTLLSLVAGCAVDVAPEPVRQPSPQPITSAPTGTSETRPPSVKTRPAARKRKMPREPEAYRRKHYPRDPALSGLAAELAQIDNFALGPVGYAGRTGRGEELARSLAREPDAVAMFARLIVHPNPAARLYAYWALTTLDPALARQHAQALRTRERAWTMAGCVGYEEEMYKLVALIERSSSILKMP